MSVVVKTSIVKCQLWSKVQQSSVTKSLSGQKSVLWQYQLWSFQERDTKLESFLPKNQLTKRKLLNFELMTSRQKLAIILVIKFFKY